MLSAKICLQLHIYENNITPLAIGLSVTLFLLTVLLVIIVIVAHRQHCNVKYKGQYSPREAEIASGHHDNYHIINYY